MSLLRDIMDESFGIVTEALGSAFYAYNGDTGELILNEDDDPITVNVILNENVDVYENKVFIGVETTATIDRNEYDLMIGDEILKVDGEQVRYKLDGITTRTPTKIIFIARLL